MAGPLRCRDEKEGASPRDQPWKGEREYITEEQVRHVRYQRPLSAHLLKKYEYQYRQRCQYKSEDEEYEHRTVKSLKRREDTHDHWHCPFFKYCWNFGMSRLPTINNCSECEPRNHNVKGVSVFQRLGPMPPQDKQAKSSRGRTLKKKISTTGRAGALTDLVILRNTGYSGYALWRKPRPSTLRY
jgi:hypothetical protein